jgi:hypothetical protein
MLLQAKNLQYNFNSKRVHHLTVSVKDFKKIDTYSNLNCLIDFTKIAQKMFLVSIYFTKANKSSCSSRLTNEVSSTYYFSSALEAQ